MVIVTFHRVLPADQRAEYPSPEIAVTPDELDWFLGFFRERFSCGTLRETMTKYAAGMGSKGGSDRPFLAVTFDDGQRDNFQHARPVLAKHRDSASFFVVADAVGKAQALWHDRLGYALRAGLRHAPVATQSLLREAGVSDSAFLSGQAIGEGIERTKQLPPEAIEERVARVEAIVGGGSVPSWDGLMDWQQLRTLVAEGHEIGSHSFSHPILTACDDARLAREASQSKQVIEAELGAPIESFCYPNGNHDDRVVAAIEAAGYRFAVTTQWGINDRSTSLYRLRRCDIQGATARNASGHLSPDRLAWRLSGLHPGLR